MSSILSVVRRSRLRRPRPRPLAALLAIALAHWAASPVLADSAVGVDTALGNALNPPGRPANPRPLALDADDAVRRSPSGQLYAIPTARSEERNKTEGGWEYDGGVDFGLLAGMRDRRNALFGKYKDVHNGPTLDYFEAQADRPESGHYVQTFGGALGRQDQFVGVQFGRYGDWKVKFFYSELKHVYTDTYLPLFDGVGTGNLTLAGGLKPMGGAAPVTAGSPTVGTGACTVAAPCWRYTGADGVARVYSNATALIGINWTGSATTAAGTAVSPNSIAGGINSYLSGVDGSSELAALRRRAGVSGEMRLDNRWKVYAGLTQERRTGARPFGMNENNYTVEIPEPIDYTTHDLLAGLSYVEPNMQGNLRLSGSLFNNHVSSLTVQQPWLAAATGIGAAQTTQFALYPDNKAFNMKAEFAKNVPEFLNARFTANASWGTSRQDQALMMPVDPTQTAQITAALGTPVLAGINNPGYATNTLDLRNWDGSRGLPLSQASAQQRIDTRLINVGLALRPLDDLGLKLDYRHYESLNKGGYLAYNPLTGQFGRGFRNSTAFDLVVGSSGASGAIGVPCYVPPGFPSVAGCTFNGNAGVAGQSTNNPANVPVFSPPRDVKQTNVTASADYDLGVAGSVNLAVEREELHRTYREREKTWEDRIKLGYTNRGFEDLTLRMSFENGRRRGSEYEFWPVEDMGTGLPGLDWDTIVSQYLKTAAAAPGWTVAPASLSGYLARYAYDSRKYDQADRNQQVSNLRANFAAREDLDLGVSLQYRNVSYPSSDYGLAVDRGTSVNLDATYQPSLAQQLYGYYSWQGGTRSTRANAGTNAAGASNTCTFPVGSALTTSQAIVQCAQQVWLAASAWDTTSTDRTEVFGLGFQTELGRTTLALDYTFSRGTTTVGYSFGPNVLTAAQALAAGTAFPAMSFRQNTATVQLLVPLDKKIAARFLIRHEAGRISDWHYDGMPVGASAAENNATLMLDAGPTGYSNTLFGIFIQFKL
ncbi:MAG: MtrB/PioB family outer membrane beta-barrel protein [Burkholderiales bacterium]|nr:MtrB/PioB family outer membrane beta-barrel protein [Burkholderiales bacterium]